MRACVSLKWRTDARGVKTRRHKDVNLLLLPTFSFFRRKHPYESTRIPPPVLFCCAGTSQDVLCFLCLTCLSVCVHLRSRTYSALVR